MNDYNIEFKTRIEFPNDEAAQTIKKAVEPEINDERSNRYRVEVRRWKNRLIIKVVAKDITALRAAVNAYLRYINAWWNLLPSLR